jgi:type IV pilus assembly protein PilM
MALPFAIFGKRLLGMGPVAAPPHVFALDAATLRYGRFVHAGDSWELRELRRVELGSETFHPGLLGGALREPVLFGEKVAQLLAGLSAPVREASLVLPDAWLRLTFVESGELPRAAEAADEVVRWKVKRLLPFRVEDLRLATSEVAPLPQQSEPKRLLVAYALETLLAGLEEAFAKAGVWLGRITSESLALLPAVGEALGEAPLGALAVVRGGGYTLLFTRRGEPVLYRFKSLDELPSSTVERDLRLTRAFVGEQLPDLAVARVVVAASDANRDEARSWQEWLGAGLGRAGEPLESLRLPLASAERVGWMEVAPMLGAARQEVV